MNLKRKELLLLLILATFLTVDSNLRHLQSFRDKRKILKRDLPLPEDTEPLNSEFQSRNVTKTCAISQRFTISGPVLKLSDIPPKKDRQCEKWRTSGTNLNYRTVELFATEKIYIDEDFVEIGEEVSLVIIAPTWEVVGKRKIILDGRPGEAHHEIEAETGVDGKFGLPGGRGGKFYGIGKTFINGENLIISANGGNGSSGQNGGDGADGLDGHTYKTEEGLDGLEHPQYRVKYETGKYDSPGTTTVYYTVDGLFGTIGGNAGDGGFGGRGGKKGDIKIVRLDDSEEDIVFTAENGSDGLPGLGGKGGKGGLNARTVKFSYQNIDSWSYFSPTDETDNGAAPDGEDGKPGANILNSKYTRDTQFNFPNAVNDFKFYARLYLLENDTKFTDFFNLLDQDRKIINYYDTLGFVDEFYHLEVLIFHFQKKEELLPLFDSMNNRILNYTERQGYRRESWFLRSFLNQKHWYYYPYTFETYDNVDLLQYRNELAMYIERINEVQENLKIIQEFQDEEMKLENTFARAKSLVSRENHRAIQKEKSELDRTIELIVRNSSKEGKREELKMRLVQRHFLESFESLNFELEFVHNIYFLRYLTLEHKHNNGIIPDEVQDSYQELAAKYKNFINKRLDIISSHQNFIKEMKQRVKSEEDAKALDALSLELSNLMEDSRSAKWIKEDLFKKEIKIISQILYHKRKHPITYKVIKYLKSYSYLAQIFGDSYRKFVDKRVVGEIGRAILELEEDIEELNLRREDAYDCLFPDLNSLRIDMKITDVNTSVSALIKSSSIAGNVVFSMISRIDKLQFKMEILNESELKMYPLPISLDSVINDIRFLGSGLFQMFAKIEFNSMNLNVIRDLRDHGVLITYQRELQKLYKNANIALIKYNKMMTHYRQDLFPYGVEYLQCLAGDDFEGNKNDVEKLKLIIPKLDGLLFKYKVGELHSIFDRMSTCEMESEKYKEDIILDSFESPNGFYTWRNEEYYDEIRDFLSGKEVTLRAIATQRNESGHAFIRGVKFKNVDLKLVSKEEKFQKEVEEWLHHFDVILTHHGDSHYRCNDDVYVITSDSYHNRYQFDSKFVGKNYMLSPYATWTLKLERKLYDNTDFIVFETFRDFIDLELVGLGSYFVGDVCESGLHQFYKKEGEAVEPEFVRYFDFFKV